MRNEGYPDSAILKFSVSVHQDSLVDLKFDSNGWARLPGGEGVSVFLEISPEGWRELGRALARCPNEPEWRLEHQRFPDGTAASPFFDCRPSTNELSQLGPGGYMHQQSCYFSLRIRQFNSLIG